MGSTPCGRPSEASLAYTLKEDEPKPHGQSCKTHFAPSLGRPAKHKTSITLQSDNPPPPPRQDARPEDSKCSWSMVNSAICVFSPGPLQYITRPHARLTFPLVTLVSCVCALLWAGGRTGTGGKRKRAFNKTQLSSEWR